MKEEPILVETDGYVLEQLQRHLVHPIVVLAEELTYPLELLLGWEGGVLVEGQLECLIGAELE